MKAFRDLVNKNFSQKETNPVFYYSYLQRRNAFGSSICKVLNLLLRYQARGGAIFPSHQTMARTLGCSTKSTERAVKQLESLGLIAVRRRHKMSNQYTLSGLFEDPVVRLQFKDLIPFFRRISLAFLFSSAGTMTGITAFKEHMRKGVCLNKDKRYISYSGRALASKRDESFSSDRVSTWRGGSSFGGKKVSMPDSSVKSTREFVSFQVWQRQKADRLRHTTPETQLLLYNAERKAHEHKESGVMKHVFGRRAPQRAGKLEYPFNC